MIYEYHCPACDMNFDVVKGVAEYDSAELCRGCGKVAIKVFTPPQLYGTKVEDASWNPGLGCVTRGSQHARQIAKERGLIEVGTERPEKHLKVVPKPYD